MKESKVKSVAVVLGLSVTLLTVFHAIGGGLSVAAWLGVAIMLAVAVVGAVRPRHQGRC